MLNLKDFRFFKTNNKVVAIRTYIGKTVKGIAKCDPRDNYDEEIGMKLAAARCNNKVATKRMHRSYNEMLAAERDLKIAEAKLTKASNYFQYACLEKSQAKAELDNILEPLK